MARFPSIDESTGTLRPEHIPPVEMPDVGGAVAEYMAEHPVEMPDVGAAVADYLAEHPVASVGLASVDASGPVEVDARSGWTVEVTGTGPVSLVGEPGWQVALVLAETTSVEGDSLAAGTWVAHRLTTGWRFHQVGASAPALVEVTPSAPSWDDSVATVTLAAQDGITWQIDGETRAPGTYQVTAPATVKVTASALAGYTIVGVASWSHEFPALAAPTRKPNEISGLRVWWDIDDAATVTVTDGRITQVASRGPQVATATVVSGAVAPLVGSWGTRRASKHTESAQGLRHLVQDSAQHITTWTALAAYRADSLEVPHNSAARFGQVYVQFTTNGKHPSFSGIPAVAPGVGSVMALAVSDDGMRIFSDGVQVQTTTTQDRRLAYLEIGSITNGAGNSTLAEMITYDRVLTDAEIAELSAYLKAKWGTR